MRENFLFGLMERNRERLLTQMDNCPADRRSIVPNGFNNSIHWHLGHILTATDGLMYGLSGETAKLAASYKTFFSKGTKPADWTEAPPSWEEITAQLREQPREIRETFAGKLQAPVRENFLNAETVEELLVGVLLHENTHAGNINAMLKIK